MVRKDRLERRVLPLLGWFECAAVGSMDRLQVGLTFSQRVLGQGAIELSVSVGFGRPERAIPQHGSCLGVCLHIGGSTLRVQLCFRVERRRVGKRFFSGLCGPKTGGEQRNGT